MGSPRSVTHWIGQLRAGDPVAAQHLWEGYFRRLVGLARGKLQGLPRRAADEEDVALSAFASFYRGVECGRLSLRLVERQALFHSGAVVARGGQPGVLEQTLLPADQREDVRPVRAGGEELLGARGPLDLG